MLFIIVTAAESPVPPGTWRGAVHVSSVGFHSSSGSRCYCPPFQLTMWGLREGEGPTQGHRARAGGPACRPACWKHRARGWAGRCWAGAPLKGSCWRGRACRGWVSGLAAEEPGSCSGYFDNNVLNTWCVLDENKLAHPLALCSPTAKSPKKFTDAPPRATGQALTPASPRNATAPLVSRPGRPQLALGSHRQALRSQEQAQEREGQGAGVPLLWGQQG